MIILKLKSQMPLIEQLLSSVMSFLLIIIAVSTLSSPDAVEFGKSILFITIGNLFLIALTFYPHTTLRLKNSNNPKLFDRYIFTTVTFILITAILSLVIYTNYKGSYSDFIFISYIIFRLYLEFIRKLFLINNSTSSLVLFHFANFAILATIFILDFNDLHLFTLNEFIVYQLVTYIIFTLIIILKRGFSKPPITYLLQLLLESKWYLLTAIGQNLSSNLALVYLANMAEGFYFLIYKSIQNLFNLFNPLLSYFDGFGYTQTAKLKAKGLNYIFYLIKIATVIFVFFICFFIIFNIFSKEIITFFYTKEISKYSELSFWFSFLTILSLFLTFFSIIVRVNQKSYLGSIAYAFTSIFAYVFAQTWVEEMHILGAIYITASCSLITLFIYGVGCFNECKSSSCSAWKSKS